MVDLFIFKKERKRLAGKINAEEKVLAGQQAGNQGICIDVETIKYTITIKAK